MLVAGTRHRNNGPDNNIVETIPRKTSEKITSEHTQFRYFFFLRILWFPQTYQIIRNTITALLITVWIVHLDTNTGTHMKSYALENKSYLLTFRNYGKNWH